MNRTPDIESFLKENKPQIKENPYFLLEVQQKMRAVEGIKGEVDRQRRYGRTALAAALVFGIVAGAALITLTYLYPIDQNAIAESSILRLIEIIEPWKYYFIIPTAVCAIALGIVLGGRKQNSMSI